MEETRKDKLQLLVRRIFLIITDILLINGAVYLSLIMRFNVEISSIEEQYIRNYEKAVIPLSHWLYFGLLECITVFGSMPV